MSVTGQTLYTVPEAALTGLGFPQARWQGCLVVAVGCLSGSQLDKRSHREHTCFDTKSDLTKNASEGQLAFQANCPAVEGVPC